MVSSVLANSLFIRLILLPLRGPNFRAPSILFIMEFLSDLKLSSSLSEDMICLFNLFALFFRLFICLALSGLGVEGRGGGGGGIVGFGGLVRGAAGGISKAINSAFLNLEYLLNPYSFARAFSSGTFMFSILYI